MKFRKGGFLMSILWIFIAILHTINYGIWAGVVMFSAAGVIIIYQIEMGKEK